jgi:hypothetical protein
MADELSGELEREIQKFNETVFPQLPKEIAETLLSTTARQVASGIAGKAKQQGDPAPNFVLRNVHGATVELSRVLERGPAVVTFYRGGW